MRALAEATLTLVLFADAARIDLRALRRGLRPSAPAAVGRPAAHHRRRRAPRRAHLRVAELCAEALVLAVLLAPTDAALGQAVVTEPRLPLRVRQGLNVESGLNDGICVPLLLIVLAAADVDAHVTEQSPRA